jgi:biopolymer transport protein ExbD
MPIAAPKGRLLQRVGLAFVRKKISRGRSVNATLSLTSMIDFLVVTVVFLLTAFRAPDACGCARDVEVPSAGNTSEMIDAPIVMVSSGEVLVDGALAASVFGIESSKRLERVDGLFNLLKSKRELWKALHPSREFPGAVVLQIDQNVPAIVVKSVFQTAAYAGYPSVSFMVKARGKRLLPPG